MKTLFSKFYGLIIVALLFPFLLTSCEQDGKGLYPPRPSENPVTLTAAAQTKDIQVKDLARIHPENPETDRNEKDENFTLVGNDWVTISRIITTTDRESLKIEVKENTSNKLRTYNLQMTGKLGDATLHVIQSGK